MVRLSVMPKGVEHPLAAASTSLRGTVRLSVMPKGVEHTTIASLPGIEPPGATFSDAERR